MRYLALEADWPEWDALVNVHELCKGDPRFPAFEVDEFDPIDHSGWSVAVTGVATEVIDPAELDRARHAPTSHWTPPGDEALIAISTELVSGRRTTTGSLAMRR